MPRDDDDDDAEVLPKTHSGDFRTPTAKIELSIGFALTTRKGMVLAWVWPWKLGWYAFLA